MARVSTALVEPDGWPDDAIYDKLIGDWSIYQRKHGHKTSTDDVLAAWLAVRMSAQRPAVRYLDLGCGIGSVLLMTCHSLRPQFSVGIEAQKQSAAMAQASVEKLPQTREIQIIHGDFRTAINDSLASTFDIVTASPPYFPVGAGTMSKDYQRAACRFELRGGVEAYFEAAARAMSDNGRFILVFQTEWDERVLKAALSVNLYLQHRVDVLMRTDKDRPFLSVYSFQRTPETVTASGFAIRNAAGKITQDYRRARSEIGLSTAD